MPISPKVILYNLIWQFEFQSFSLNYLHAYFLRIEHSHPFKYFNHLSFILLHLVHIVSVDSLVYICCV